MLTLSFRHWASAALLAGGLLGSLPTLADQPPPEAASGFARITAPTAFDHAMIVTANPLASDAGAAILRQGGSAVDALIAAQWVLGLTEPQSSGLGGGGFLLTHDGKRTLQSWDGRETAPAAARGERFIGADGKPLPFTQAVASGKAVGVPGLVAMLYAAHQQHGKLPWAALAQPAIQLAEQGFAVSPRLYTLLVQETRLQADANARRYFFSEDGRPRPVGSLLRNPDYADTLRRIARQGPAGFYQGPVAADMVRAVQNHPTPGDLTLADLASYRPKQRAPLCGPYRQWQVCGMGAPSSGGVAVLQLLGMLARFQLNTLPPTSADAVHLYSEAGRLAFADRERYLADPDFVAVPQAGLIAPDYLAARSQLIDPQRSHGPARAGEPAGVKLSAWGRDAAPELLSTTHLVAFDRDGRAASMTSSVEDAFGSRIMVRGFLLNNQMTDFSFLPEQDGAPVANRIQPGKRPRSAMSPTLVLDQQGQVQMAVGSPGGSLIIHYVAQALLGLLEWRLDPQAAANLPHYGSRNGPTELEADQQLERLIEPLRQRGHEVKLTPMTSGLSIIVRQPQGGYLGGADPRREGKVSGF